jgi:insulin-like growth factor 2 mRNA-binding protein 1
MSVALVYVVQHLGAVLQLSMSIPSACFGPMLGVYVIGFCLPWIGRKATFYAAIFAWISMLALIFKAQAEMALGNIRFETKPLSVDGCTYSFTPTIDTLTSNSTEFPMMDAEREKKIYDVSYLYYSPLGAIIVIVSAFILSFIFGFQEADKVDSRLLAPFLRKYIKSAGNDKVQYSEKGGKEAVVHTFDMKEESNSNIST